MNPLVAILIALGVMQLVALVAAVVARYWVLRSETYELHGIDVERATELVAFYLQGVHDHRFGFPTGVFVVEQGQIAPGRVVAREINIQGSAGIAPIKFGLKLPIIGAGVGAAIAAEADDAGGCFIGMFAIMAGAALGALAAAVLVIPFAYLTVVEMVLRLLMRGEIAATIEKVPEEEASVRVRFEMRGLSAFGVEHQLQRGMKPPQPVGAPLPKPAPLVAERPASQFDRLNAIYAAAASVALIFSIVAIVVVANSQTSTSSAASYAPTEETYYEEPEESFYEEEPYYEEESFEEEPYENKAESVEVEPTSYEGAKQMFRSYWTAIDEGDYGAAYDVYYRSYGIQEGVSRSEFIASEDEYLPTIGLQRMLIQPSSRNPTSPNELWLYVEVPIRDGTGEFEGQCRLFYGDVRMFHAEGRWFYRPGTAFGRKPSFGQEGGGIRSLPPSSDRCD